MPFAPTPWLHFTPDTNPRLAQTVCEALLDRAPEISMVVSGLSLTEFENDPQVSFEPAFRGQAGEAEALIAKYEPTALAWMDPVDQPAVFSIAQRASIPVAMVDCGKMIDAHKGWNLWSRVVGLRFRHVDSIFVADAPTRTSMLRAGARASQLHQTGILEVDADTLPCSHSELDRLARILAARPVWLAAKVNFDELDPVLAAHQQALRRAHRLILLVVPGDPEDGDQFAEQIRHKGLEFRQRSKGEEPDSDCQVYLADEPGELGLWYRLAPISFIGHTLAGRFGNGPDPLGAAALGSAILHGPMIEHHADSFRRLGRARASYPVAHTGELTYALETFLAPDRAARMANAAWEVCTSGAEVLNRVADFLLQSDRETTKDAR